MWVLVWFYMTTVVNHYEIGQYESERICLDELKKASILVTKNNISLVCFKVKEST
tara:strand:+ start:941 stop:1105 length:165 start_codon:yes stop_codon:yes gene_type:complete